MKITRIRITFEGNIILTYDVESKVADQLLTGCTKKLPEVLVFQDTKGCMYIIMTTKVLEIAEIFKCTR